MNAHPAAARKLLVVATAVALLPFLLLVWRFDWVCDDAYITYRYCSNFAKGLGLVYNPGVDPPVEGYSEFLWAVWIGLWMKLGAAPEIIARVTSIPCGIALVVLVVRMLATRFAPSAPALLGASVFLGTLPPLAVWSSGGMSTMPFLLAVVATFHLAWRTPEPGRGWQIGLAATAAALLRADGALWVAVVLGTALLVSFAKKDAARLRATFLGAAISAGAFGLHVAWRYATYGDWLPNTARVKIGFSERAIARGWDYVVSFGMAMPGVVLAAAVGLAALCLRRRADGAPRPPLAAAAIVLVATVLYVISSGGDFMTFGRFLLPALPFAVLLFGATLEGLGRVRLVVAPLVAAAAVGLSLPAAFDHHFVSEETRAARRFRHNHPRFFSEYRQWENMKGRAAEWSEVGRCLGKYAPEGSSLVLGAIGCVGYFSDVFIHDRNGLVTREVALRPAHDKPKSPGHDKTVAVTFFAPYEPTYLDAGIWWADQLPPRGKALHEIEVLGPAERPGFVLWVVPFEKPGR